MPDLFKELGSTQEQTVEPEEAEDESPLNAKPDELTMLKQRAKLMGINFSGNIGLDALRAKVQAKMDGEKDPGEATIQTIQYDADSISGSKLYTSDPQSIVSERQKMIDEEMRLIRCRVTNMDPKKKDLTGEIFTVANRVLGAVKKFIPYGAATDNGYHIPNVIFKQLQERQFLNIKTRKDNRGRTIVETSMAREFALEVLPQLTPQELARLAAAQAAAAGMSD
jgi:hypothetical protein